MKKLIPMFMIFILIFFTFAVEVCAFSDSFDMTIPDYYEKVSDNEWHTDELMIDNLPTEVTLTVEFYDAENSLSDFSFSLGYLKYHDEIIAREDFKEFIDGAKSTMSTAEGYEVRCASYVSSVDETEKAVCTYSFFAENQTCTFTFVADNIQFALSGEVEKIINTVTFEEDFFKTEDVEKVTVTYPSPELPKVPAIEFYTEIMTSASYGNIAHKGDSAKTVWGVLVSYSVCVVIGILVIVWNKKKKKKTKPQITKKTKTEVEEKKSIVAYFSGRKPYPYEEIVVYRDKTYHFYSLADHYTGSGDKGGIPAELIENNMVVVGALSEYISSQYRYFKGDKNCRDMVDFTSFRLLKNPYFRCPFCKGDERYENVHYFYHYRCCSFCYDNFRKIEEAINSGVDPYTFVTQAQKEPRNYVEFRVKADDVLFVRSITQRKKFNDLYSSKLKSGEENNPDFYLFEHVFEYEKRRIYLSKEFGIPYSERRGFKIIISFYELELLAKTISEELYNKYKGISEDNWRDYVE